MSTRLPNDRPELNFGSILESFCNHFGGQNRFGGGLEGVGFWRGFGGGLQTPSKDLEGVGRGGANFWIWIWMLARHVVSNAAQLRTTSCSC